MFIAASVRFGCTRVSRQFRHISDWRLHKEYTMEWIEIHASRGKLQRKNIKTCKRNQLYATVLSTCLLFVVVVVVFSDQKRLFLTFVLFFNKGGK